MAKINVDIGEGDTLGIEEALKEQLVLQRIDIGDVQRVSHQAARRRTAARTHRNALLARVANEIPDDQEITGKAHLLDQFDFAFQALFVSLQGIFQAARSLHAVQALAAMRKAFARDSFKIAVGRVARRNFKVRENVLLAASRCRLQRSAISTVRASASGTSLPNTAAISS